MPFVSDIRLTTSSLRAIAGAIALFALAACTESAPEAEPHDGTLLVRCGTLIDGLADAAVADKMVVIKDERIVAIVDGNAEVPPGGQLLDLSDKTCLPGLINTHVHLGMLPEHTLDYGVYYSSTVDEQNQLALTLAKVNLLTGFTTVRNVGDFFPDSITHAKQTIDAGEALGSRIRNGGPFFTIPGGGGSVKVPYIDEDTIPPETQRGVARGADEFRMKAKAAVAKGYDHLKVIASGAVFSFGTEPGAPEMTQEEIEAVVEVAHGAGLKVTAHVHSAQSGIDAILAGVDSIEHASLLTDEVIQMAADAGVAFSMDVYNGTYTDTVGREQGYPEEILQRNYDTTEAQRVVFEKAYAAGVPLMYGTDAGVLPHDMGGWQFGIMVERGMTPMDAIMSATSVPADHMGIAADVGALEIGRYGDLVAVTGDPLDDITVLQQVDVVIKGGAVVKEAE